MCWGHHREKETQVDSVQNYLMILVESLSQQLFHHLLFDEDVAEITCDHRGTEWLHEDIRGVIGGISTRTCPEAAQ